MLTALLLLALIILGIYAIFQKTSVLILVAYVSKKGIQPSDEELKECTKYVMKRLLGKKPRL